MIIIIEEAIPPIVAFYGNDRLIKYLIPTDIPLELLGTTKAEKLIIETRSDYQPPNLETSEWIKAFIAKARALGIPIEARTWVPMTNQEAWDVAQKTVADFGGCFSPKQTSPERARELLDLLESVESNVKFLAEPPERWEMGAILLAKIADIRDQLRELLTPPGAA